MGRATMANPMAAAIANAQSQSMNPQQIAQMYNNQLQNGYGSQQAYGAQQAAAHQHSQYIQNLGKVIKSKPFRIRDKEMDLVEFADYLYPDDCPEKTFLILKLTGETE
jgi:hypothetical protein